MTNNVDNEILKLRERSHNLANEINNVKVRVEQIDARGEVCKWGNKVPEMAEGMARVEGKIDSINTRINGALEKIADHMENGRFWRGAIVSIAICLFTSVVTLGIFLSHMSTQYGELRKQVEINTERWDRLIQEHPEVN